MEIREAHKLGETGGAGGKIVLVPCIENYNKAH
jgi:hypothetical protein